MAISDISQHIECLQELGIIRPKAKKKRPSARRVFTPTPLTEAEKTATVEVQVQTSTRVRKKRPCARYRQ